MSDVPVIFLTDNGSLRPEATFALRKIAMSLSDRLGLLVEPVSLLHSHKIEPSELQGVPATIVRRRMHELIEQGQRSFVILPLFLGPSLAIVDYLPKLIEEAGGLTPNLSVRIAEPLMGADVDAPDLRLAQILADQVCEVMVTEALIRPKVALVDHGTPIESVNRVRNHVAEQLANQLEDRVDVVVASSMERREGAEYAFNEPLLENLGTLSEVAGGNLIVAMFFLLPGRHAGPGGDVVEICDSLIEQKVFERIISTPLLGENSKLLDILEDRLSSVLSELDS